jgi:hypothetical protein
MSRLNVEFDELVATRVGGIGMGAGQASPTLDRPGKDLGGDLAQPS